MRLAEWRSGDADEDIHAGSGGTKCQRTGMAVFPDGTGREVQWEPFDGGSGTL